MKPISPLPWLHIAEVAIAAAVVRDSRRVGVTGTWWLINSSVHPDALTDKGLDFLRPTGDERVQIGLTITDELVHGIFKPESVVCFQNVITNLKEKGCDSLVLGCTEMR